MVADQKGVSGLLLDIDVQLKKCDEMMPLAPYVKRNSKKQNRIYGGKGVSWFNKFVLPFAMLFLKLKSTASYQWIP